MPTGKVLRFDEVRGYGFIAPDTGGEDVFMHANDLLDDKYLFRSGIKVAFEVEDGDRGLKASDVRIVHQPIQSHPTHSTAVAVPSPVSPPAPTSVPRSVVRSEGEDVLCDVLTADEFRQELTETIMEASPSLTATQIVQVRTRVLEMALAHSWIES